MSDSKFRILLIEDNSGDAELVANYVQEVGGGKFELHHASDLAMGRALLGSQRFDVVLLDLHLSDSDGLETLKAVCEECHDSNPMVVVLTGTDDEEIVAEAMRNCAQDYLVKKDITPRSLVHAIRKAVNKHARERVNRLEEAAKDGGDTAPEALDILQRVHKVASVHETGEYATEIAPAIVSELNTASRASETALLSFYRKLEKLEDFATQIRDIRSDLAGQHHRIRRIENDNSSRDQEKVEIREALKTLKSAVTPAKRLMHGSGNNPPLNTRLAAIETWIDEQRLLNAENRKWRRIKWAIAGLIGLSWFIAVLIRTTVHYVKWKAESL